MIEEIEEISMMKRNLLMIIKLILKIKIILVIRTIKKK